MTEISVLRQLFRDYMEGIMVSTYRDPHPSGIWPDDGVLIADLYYEIISDMAERGKLMEVFGSSPELAELAAWRKAGEFYGLSFRTGELRDDR